MFNKLILMEKSENKVTDFLEREMSRFLRTGSTLIELSDKKPIQEMEARKFASEEEKQGIKNSLYKLQMSKLFVQFPDALKAVMLASTFGHIKYEEYDKDWLNYKRVEGLSYEDALVRHQLIKDETQEESGLHPKFHIAWNALADLQKYLEDNNVNLDKIIEEKVTIWEGNFKK